MEECLWRKLAVNCAVNPLTALHQCSNGELASQPDLARQVALVCNEIARVSATAGFSDTAANIHGWTADVIAGTANNRSSMLQDVTAGRRTENHYITGHLLKIAGRLKVDTPINRAIFEEICEVDRETGLAQLL
jgi:2-dehydropantoate 2-reductase